MSRPRAHGQALTEYAILLALMGAFHRLEELTSGLAEPRTLVLAAALGLLVVFALVASRR